MNISRLSTLSLTLALAIFALGYVNPASAAPKPKECPAHPSCPDEEPPEPEPTVTYTAELKGAFAFGPLGVTLEGQDERLISSDDLEISIPYAGTGGELTAWNLVFNVCGLLDPVPEFTAPAGKKGWRISRPGGVYVLFRNVGPLPSASLGDLEISLQLIGDCAYSGGTSYCEPFPPEPGDNFGHGLGISWIPLSSFQIHATGEKGITHSIEGCHSESAVLLDGSTLVITATAP
jgi:hypothetical protein